MRWLVCLAFVATACSSSESTNYNVLPDPPPADWSQLRVVHASADTRAVDVYTRNVSDPLLSDLAYGFAQGFVEIAALDYTIDLRPAGESLNSEPTFSQDITLASEERATAVLAGSGDTLQLIRFTDDLARVDEGALRVVNATSAPLSFDFGSVAITDQTAFTVGRATLPDLQATSVTISGQAYGLPERPSVGDVVLIAADTQIMLLTYSFTLETLDAQ